MKYSHISVTPVDGLHDALTLLDRQGKELRVISGGTDVTVYLKDGNLKETSLLDVSRLKELDYVRDGGKYISIGARVTFSELLNSKLVRKWAPLLCEAGVEVGSLQIRNLATLAGNICNASPAADSLPPLYVHGSSVVLASLKGKRELPLPKFVEGPRRTARRPDELLTEIRVPKMAEGTSCFFKKLGLRSSQAISVVSVAAAWKGRSAKIALGAVAPTVIRAQAAEAYIAQHGLSYRDLGKVCLLVASAATPISDLRGTKEYRSKAIRALSYQGFYELLEGRSA